MGGPYYTFCILYVTRFTVSTAASGHSGACTPLTSLLSTAEVLQPLVGAIRARCRPESRQSAQPPCALFTAPLAAQDTEAGEWSNAGAATL